MNAETNGEVLSDFMCLRYKHLRVSLGGCDAFPEGIPDVIAENGQLLICRIKVRGTT